MGEAFVHSMGPFPGSLFTTLQLGWSVKRSTLANNAAF